MGSEGQYLHGTTQFGEESSEADGTIPACPLCWAEGEYMPLSTGKRHYTCRRHALEFKRRGSDGAFAFDLFRMALETGTPEETVIYRTQDPPRGCGRKSCTKTSVGRSKSCPVRLRR